MDKWLITDKVHESAKTLLEAMGYQVDWLPDSTNETVFERIDQYFGIIISTKTIIDRALIDKAVNLKIVGRVGSGMEHVDQDYCKKKGIACFNSPEGNANAVAEHVMGMLLSFSKNIVKANFQLKNSEWSRFENTGFEIKGRTIGIIGFGNTGSRFAMKLEGFESTILAYDKYKSGFGSNWVKETSLQDIMEKAEIISFHVPYNRETHHWINKEFILSCRKKPLIINTSRGAICNTIDLLWALNEKKIKGLCMDVFEDEPIDKEQQHSKEIYKSIIKFNNVIATPHIAGWSYEAQEAMVSILIRKISNFLQNRE